MNEKPSTDQLLRMAHHAVDGKHPEHGFTIKNGSEVAIPYTLMALAQEQRATNWHLAVIADNLSRIAKALDKPPVLAEASAPQTRKARRFWLLTRRTA